MRSIFIVGTGINGVDPNWAKVDWSEPPALDGGLQWRMSDRKTTDSLIRGAARAGIDGLAILLRGNHDGGFRQPALISAVEDCTGPWVKKPFTVLPWVDFNAAGSITDRGGQPETIFDFRNGNHREWFWTDFLKPFFTNWPEKRSGAKNPIQYERTPSGRILVTWWGNKAAVNQASAQLLFDRLNAGAAEMGIGEIDHIVDHTWTDAAPNLRVFGVHNWFQPADWRPGRPQGAYGLRTWKGITTTVAVPGFHNAGVAAVIKREGGKTLRDAIAAVRAAGADYLLFEGLTDAEECAGFYESDAWAPRTLYYDIVREGLHGVGTPAPGPVPAPSHGPIPTPSPVPVTPPTSTQWPVPLPVSPPGPIKIEGKMIAFSSPILSFKTGDLIKAGGGVAVIWPAGSDTVLSVQPDGTYQTRPKTAIGSWETARVLDGKLVYVPDGNVYVIPIVEGL